jgi:glycosyltransferase involved in cell wall biosynthesis
VQEQPSLTIDADVESFESVPLVSVIVPVYNHAKYVRESLDSIISTGYRRLEVVVVNDASDDDSDAVIRDWIRRNPNQNVVYVSHDRNMGPAKTFNEAIRAARGELLCFSSGDDLIMPNGILDRVEYLMLNPDKFLVFGDCHVIDEEGKTLFQSGIEGLYHSAGMRKKMLLVDELLPYSVFFNWAVCGPAHMIRASGFQVVGFYDESLVLDDWEMYLRMATVGKAAFIDSYVGKYRLHPHNLIKIHGSRLVDDQVKIAERYAHHFGRIAFTRVATLRMVQGYTKPRSVFARTLYLLVAGPLFLVSIWIARFMGLMLLLKSKSRDHFQEPSTNRLQGDRDE